MAIATVRKKSYGRSGLAKVKKTGSQYEIRFDDDGWKINIEQEDVPECMREGEMYVTLDEYNTKVVSIRPQGKAYYARFSGFWAEEGKLPSFRDVKFQPATRTRNWDIPSHLEMTAQFKIEGDKQWEGFLVSKPLSYCFMNYEDSGEVALTGWGSKKTEQFLTELGIDMRKDSIPYSENVLPVLQDMLRDRNVKLILNMKNGWINDISAAP